MAYLEVAMCEILNVLRRLSQGESKAAIGAVTGHSRITIRRYGHEALSPVLWSARGGISRSECVTPDPSIAPPVLYAIRRCCLRFPSLPPGIPTVAPHPLSRSRHAQIPCLPSMSRHVKASECIVTIGPRVSRGRLALGDWRQRSAGRSYRSCGSKPAVPSIRARS